MPKRNGKDVPVLHYEQELINIILGMIEKTGRCMLLVNKSRKIGMTEFTLRYIAWQAFRRYAGYDVMIVAQREEQAKKNMERLQAILEPTGMVASQNVKEMRLHNGTRIWVFPSNSQAFRGPDRVKCVFLDEAAHFDAVDDEPIFAALMPVLANTNGDAFLISTPAGPRGFFWRIYHDPESTFRKETMPWTISKGLLIDEAFIESERRNNIWFDQEYCNQFLASSSSVFTHKDLEDIFT